MAVCIVVAAWKRYNIKMTYSHDFRQHILSTKKKENLSLRKTSKRFEVSINTLQWWIKDIFPKNCRNKKPVKIPNEKRLQDVNEYPDAFQYERAERLGVSQRGISHALKRLKITRKKRFLGIQ